VAVRGGAHHLHRADDAAGPGAVLGHGRAAEAVLQMRGQQAAHDVGGAAGRRRHHDAHCWLRPHFALRLGPGDQGGREGQREGVGGGTVMSAVLAWLRRMPQGRIDAKGQAARPNSVFI
jgi:hypothetical protein